MMFDDTFYRTDSGEIFHKSCCMWHERTTTEFLASMLVNLGYTKTDNYRIWKRNHETAIICFADDYGVCRRDWALPPQEWFDSNTVVITDNRVNFLTQYRVKQVPESYFGVFNYLPEKQDWQPERRFNFAVNRLDTQRLLILLELISRSGLDQDFANFNCWNPSGPNDTLEHIQQSFTNAWNQVGDLQARYESLIPNLIKIIPIRNHTLTIEEAHVRSWVNVVVETYAGDHTIAFSEKIFRALVTPAPWTVYSALGAVNYLKELGFDVLDDLIDHSYNLITQDDTLYGIKKIEAFITSNINLYQALQTQDFAQIKNRCLKAAKHNQQLLSILQQRWPEDFACWMSDTLIELKTTK